MPHAANGDGIRWIYVSAGGNHTCAIAAGSQLACWGKNEQGQTNISRNMDRDVASVGSGKDFTCAIKNSNQLQLDRSGNTKFDCWGEKIM
mmetsp:Transcript_35082/g.29606  ORF Transcript_35082/g.29606 Transcript_35082/m.29606 type:complete len:90 (-) Transcript_35082:113-382(-)